MHGHHLAPDDAAHDDPIQEPGRQLHPYARAAHRAAIGPVAPVAAAELQPGADSPAGAAPTEALADVELGSQATAADVSTC